MALKAAETDATKRALATFGNPFGLALYDRDQAHVTKPKAAAKHLTLILADQRSVEVSDPVQLVEATRRELSKVQTLDEAYAFWTANLAAFTDAARHDGGKDLPSLLKERLREIGQRKPPSGGMLIPKETRIRDKEHLAFVGRQPCLICGRRPSHAHHLKFAQPRSMAMKVSDEYTVPLCSGHHDSLHRAGDERAWLARHGMIDPLKFAHRLWAASRSGQRDGYDETSAIDTDPPKAHSDGQTNGPLPE
jgi:hypothetical protein